MTRHLSISLLVLASCALLLAQSGQQPKLSVHTQVREDIFAGYIGNDMERFEVGVKKLHEILRENPENAPALGWLGSVELYRAVLAREAGKESEFRSLYARSQETMARARALAPRDFGVVATTGATLILFADRLPAEEKLEAYKKGRALFKELGAVQQKDMDRLPLHLRGELLAGLAQSAERLGDWEDAKVYLTQMVNSLGDTPYERKAKKWLEDPASANNSTMVCQTCHDAGRLENRLKAQKQP